MTAVQLNKLDLQQRSSRNTVQYLFGICLAFCCGLAVAEVTEVIDSTKCPVDHGGCWEISGFVSDSDYRAVVKIAGKLTGTMRSPFFRLNSSGGNVESAVAIGRELRRMRAYVLTWDEAPCHSSCIFILAGGVRRILGGNVGIHRPYFASTEKRDYDTAQREQRRLASLARAYLEEVNVSPTLFDAMMRIPPERIRILTRSELEIYGITETDPIEQELADAADARKYGLSKTEYLRRKAVASTKCASAFRRGEISGNFDEYVRCYDEMLRSAQ